MAHCTIFVLVLLTLSLQLGKAFAKAFLEAKDDLAKSNHKHDSTEASDYYQSNLYGPHTYTFGYMVNNKASGNVQFRNESKYGNNTVQGSYGYVQPDQSLIVTHHFTDRAYDYSGQVKVIKPEGEVKSQTINVTKPNDEDIDENITSIIDQKNTIQNLTDVLLPVERVNAKDGINLNPAKLEKELINPMVLETVNGTLPLEGITKDEKGFDNLQAKPVHKFIPNGFPIIPFQFPANEKSVTNNSATRSDYTANNNLEKIINEDKTPY
uniref:Cuticle protein 6 n=1 Tax=Glossina austeni TaxID=7395 RepID=A0A1A9VMV7_GLOAU